MSAPKKLTMEDYAILVSKIRNLQGDLIAVKEELPEIELDQFISDLNYLEHELHDHLEEEKK